MKLTFSSLINFGFSASTATIRESCPDLNRNEACKGVCFNQAKMCLDKCTPDDQRCITLCTRQADFCIEECPCGSECPAGCKDCDSWACHDDNILVLNQSINDPVIFSPIKKGGEMMISDSFFYNKDTGVSHSCSAIFQGRMMIFGGYASSYKRQISEVVKSPKCQLERRGSLDLDFDYGACGTYSNINGAAESVLLCFPTTLGSNCYQWLGEDLKDMPITKYSHLQSSLGIYDDKPVAIAGTRTSQIEIFSNGAWEEKGNMIPVHIGDLSLFSTVTFNKELYVFGGYSSDVGYYINLAAKYTGSKWTTVGQLKSARSGHRSIANDYGITHVGGRSSQHFETWKWNGRNFSIEDSTDTLSYYYDYPESFYLPWDFVAYCLPKPAYSA